MVTTVNKLAWVFKGDKEDTLALWNSLPKSFRDCVILAPVENDNGDWIRFKFCGVMIRGIVCDRRARLSQGAFDYLMSRLRDGDWFFDLDEHHTGLAEDWAERALNDVKEGPHRENILKIIKALRIETSETP